MKSKWIKRLLSGMLIFVLVLSCVSPASALEETDTTKFSYLTNTLDYPNGTYAVIIAVERTDVRRPITSTQAQHVQGATLTLSLDRGYVYGLQVSSALEVSANAQLEVGVAKLANASFGGSLALQIGVAASVQYETATSITYELDNEIDPGFYRLVEVYPAKRLTLQVVGQNIYGFDKILASKSIDYAPRLSGAYITFEEFDPDTA